MNDPLQVYIQIDGREPHAVTVEKNETISTLLARLRNELSGSNQDFELLAVFADDEEEEARRDHTLCECRPHQPKLLYCHRCKKIGITVFYNGTQKREFSPNVKIRSVAHWAMKEFKVDEGRKWVLRLGAADGEILDFDGPIGKHVKAPDCSLSLYLTERCMIQG